MKIYEHGLIPKPNLKKMQSLELPKLSAIKGSPLDSGYESDSLVSPEKAMTIKKDNNDNDFSALSAQEVEKVSVKLNTDVELASQKDKKKKKKQKTEITWKQTQKKAELNEASPGLTKEQIKYELKAGPKHFRPTVAAKRMFTFNEPKPKSNRSTNSRHRS